MATVVPTTVSAFDFPRGCLSHAHNTCRVAFVCVYKRGGLSGRFARQTNALARGHAVRCLTTGSTWANDVPGCGAERRAAVVPAARLGVTGIPRWFTHPETADAV